MKIPVFKPEISTYTRYKPKGKKTKDSRGVIYDKEKCKIIRKYYYKKTNEQIASIIGCRKSTVVVTAHKMGMAKKTNHHRKTPACMGFVMEDYFGNGLSIKECILKHGSTNSSISHYLSLMFFKDINDRNTEVITLKSKI